MKVNRERNPYLKRIFSEQPHKYSYTHTHIVTISILANTFLLVKTELIYKSILSELSELSLEPTSVALLITRLAIMMQKSTPLSFTTHLILSQIPNIQIQFLINSLDTLNIPIK
jgi:hypothetical protein